MPEITQEMIDEQAKLVKELRENIEEKDVLNKEKEQKLNAKLDTFEVENQKLVTKQLESEKTALEQKEALEGRYNELEKKLLRLPAGGTEAIEAKEASKAFETMIRKGVDNLTPDEVKYLRTDSDSEGGYLATPEMDTELLKNITELSPVRSLARVTTTGKRGVQIRKRTGIPTAYRVGQGVQDTQSQSAYGMEDINIERATVDIPITIEMLSDADWNMESEMNQDAGEAFAVLEGTEFISGSGVGEMEGILTNADVAETVSGIADAITGDSLIDISATLKDGYIGRYLMNRVSLGVVRKLKDGQGQYIWQNGLAAGLPSTINGDEYVSAIDMPNIGAGLYPVAYGDFARGYRLVESSQTTILRDQYTLGRSGKVLFIFHRRNGGKVVLPEAIKKLKISV
jgi:HK97 family phage major capsid protein